MTAVFIVAGICLLAVYVVYLLLSRKISRILDSEKLLAKVDEEINSLVLELNQTTERNILLVEDRIKKLSELISNSDRSILLLSKELKKKEKETISYSHLEKKRSFPIKECEKVKESFKNDENLNNKDRILELNSKGMSSRIIAAKTGTSIGEVELIISLNSRKG